MLNTPYTLTEDDNLSYSETSQFAADQEARYMMLHRTANPSGNTNLEPKIESKDSMWKPAPIMGKE